MISDTIRERIDRTGGNKRAGRESPQGASVKLSVITAVYNARRTLQDALDSVRRQTHPAIEHVVIDGASTDGTAEILERNRGSIAVLVSEPDAGIYDALNKGIRLSSGEVIGFLHADDVFAAESSVARIASVFEDPDVEAVYGDLQYVSHGDTSRTIRYWRAGSFSAGRLAWGWMPPHPTLYVRRRVYERLGNFDTRYRIAADYDWMLRFLRAGGIPPVYLAEVIVKMRVGGASNRSISSLLRKSREDYRALRDNGVGGIGALAWKNFGKLRQFLVRGR